MGMHGDCISIALVLLVSAVHPSAAGPSNARLLSRLQAAAAGTVEPCQPWTVPAADGCAYVRDHSSICYPNGGFQEYLAVHYCFFGPAWRWASLLVLLAAATLAFAILLTVSERFFCPALELISDYLRLPPVVAGATLLSFGNGAPDTFTQVAAVAQDGGSAVGMALAEPLGGGMFASNVVFGLVVLIASKQQAVIQRWAFLKDVGFYLASLIVIAFMLADGKVTPVEASILCGMYLVYVCATFYTSRADEPLHADLALHEFPPQDGGIDAFDSSEDFHIDSEIDTRSEGDHPECVDATTSIREYDLEAAPSDLSCKSSSPGDFEAHTPGVDHKPSSGSSGGSGSGTGSRTLQALLSWRHKGSQTGVREPLLVAIDESPAQSGDGQQPLSTQLTYEADSSGDTVVGSRAAGRRQQPAAATAPGGSATVQQQASDKAGAGAGAAAGSAAGAANGSPDLPAPAFARLGQADCPGPLSPGALSPPAAPRSFAAHGRRSFTEDTWLSLPGGVVQHGPHSRGSSITSPVAGGSPDRADVAVQSWSPRAASDSLLSRPCSTCGANGISPFCTPAAASLTLRPHHSATAGGLPLTVPPSPMGSAVTPRRRTFDGAWVHSDSGGGGPPLSPHMQQLQQQHFAEQVELLEQQAAEHHALLAEHEEHEDELKAGGMSFKHKLQYPFVQVLSCTMPRVGTGSGHRYTRWRACLLPLTVPLLWLVADTSLLSAVGWQGVLFGAACAAVSSSILWATYPASSVPRKTLKGVFAVLAFVQAIVWLDISASALVQVCVVVGTIFGLQPALLGATVLAWGNSVPDLINNMAMAKDGFPSMAVAACFASPLFTLLVGMGGALSYGTILHGGPLSIPVDGPLMVMAGFSIVNMVQHLIVVPLVHRYRMKPSIAVITFLFYVCFNVLYVLATVGVIHIETINPV